jgi:hypothetical protein
MAFQPYRSFGENRFRSTRKLGKIPRAALDPKQGPAQAPRGRLPDVGRGIGPRRRRTRLSGTAVREGAGPEFSLCEGGTLQYGVAEKAGKQTPSTCEDLYHHRSYSR